MLHFAKLYLKGLLFFVGIMLFCFSTLPHELEFSVRNPQYMEFYLYQDRSIAGNAQYRLCGSAFCEPSDVPQVVKFRFVNGNSPEIIAIQCGYESVTFSLCSNVAYRYYGIFSYTLKKKDFLKSYRPKSMPEFTGGDQLKINTSGKENIFYPQKAEIQRNFTFSEIKISKYAVLLFAVLLLGYTISVFCVWKWGKYFSFSMIPRKKQVARALLWMLFFLCADILFYGVNTINLLLRLPAYFVVPMIIDLL